MKIHFNVSRHCVQVMLKISSVNENSLQRKSSQCSGHAKSKSCITTRDETNIYKIITQQHRQQHQHQHHQQQHQHQQRQHHQQQPVTKCEINYH